MNENSNMNENALMMALGKSFNSYSSTASISTKINEMNLILKDCLTSIICDKIMNNSNKHSLTGMDDFLHQIIR